MSRRPPISTLFPYTTLFRSVVALDGGGELPLAEQPLGVEAGLDALGELDLLLGGQQGGLADGVEVHAHQVGRHQATGVRLASRRADLEGVTGGGLQERHGMSSSLPVVRMHRPAVGNGGAPASGVGRRCPGGTPMWSVVVRCVTPRATVPTGPGVPRGPTSQATHRACVLSPPVPGRSPDQTSSSKVIGPSFTDATAMRAPNTPVATSLPRRRSSATTSPTSGSATSPGAAASHDGRRPLRVSA